jgi:hypothetical protein
MAIQTSALIVINEGKEIAQIPIYETRYNI